MERGRPVKWRRQFSSATGRASPSVELQRPWQSAEYLSLDFEATGLDLRNDDVVSFGAVPIRDGRIVVGEFAYSLVRPTKPVPPESSKFHVIRNQDLADAPTGAEAAAVLMNALQGRVLLAHAAWVESAFLRRLFKLQGVSFVSPVIDTAALARALGLRPRIDTHEPHLETLANELGVPVHDPHHALGDAFTTAQVFLVLGHRLERQHGPLEVADLVNFTREYALLRP